MKHELQSFSKRYYNGDVDVRPYCACGWIGKWTGAMRSQADANEKAMEQQVSHLEGLTNKEKS